MAKGLLILENPGGIRKRVPIGFSWLMLAFGPIVPLVRGQFLHVLLSFLAIMPTLGISWFIYPFFINYFHRVALLHNGYLPIEVVGISEQALLQRTEIRLRTKPNTFSKKHFRLWFTFIAALVIPLTLFILAAIVYEGRLSKLRVSDPKQYLEEVRGTSRYWEDLKQIDPVRYERELEEQEALREIEAQHELDALQIELGDADPTDNANLRSIHERLYKHHLERFKSNPNDTEAEAKAREHKKLMEHYAAELDIDVHCTGEEASDAAYEVAKDYFMADARLSEGIADALGIEERWLLNFPPRSAAKIVASRQPCHFAIQGKYEITIRGREFVKYKRVSYELIVKRGRAMTRNLRGEYEFHGDDYWDVWAVTQVSAVAETSDDGILWDPE